VTDQTVTNWVSKKRNDPDFREYPESRQHFDVWQFQSAAGDAHLYLWVTHKFLPAGSQPLNTPTA
jgi:hypothetical protein